MAIRFESDRVWIGGVWFSKTRADIVKLQGERNALNGAPAMTPSPLADIHKQLFTYDEARQLGGLVKTMTNNEDEARRRALLDLDARVAGFLHDAKVPETLDKVRGIMADMDLTHEAKQKRAIAMMEELQGRVQGYFGRILSGLMDELNKAERLIDGALLPEPRPAGQEAVTELRAQEIRAYLASLDDAGRMGAVLKYGEKAKLEALHAMTDDPNGRDFVDRAFLDNARCAAVRAQGGEWLLDDLADARDMLQGVATRATLVESLLWNGMGVLGVKVKQGPSQWASMAAAAVKASNEWLTL